MPMRAANLLEAMPSSSRMPTRKTMVLIDQRQDAVTSGAEDGVAARGGMSPLQ
jgi:hypothetical protein